MSDVTTRTRLAPEVRALRARMAQVDEALLPTDEAGRYLTDPAAAALAPELGELQRMSGDVGRALARTEEATAALVAAQIVTSWPQREDTGVEYTTGMARRLQLCPPDLLGDVLAYLQDHHAHRPSIAEVKAAVARAMAPRRNLLLRISAAQCGRRAHERRVREQKAEAMARQAMRETGFVPRMVPKDEGGSAPPAPPPADPPRAKVVQDRKPLTPEELAIFRARRGAISHR